LSVGTGSSREIVDAGNELAKKFKESQDKLNQGGLNPEERTQTSANQDKLAASLTTLIDLNRQQADAIKKNIDIIEKKNELDKASIKDLLNGDVFSFIKKQQAKGAQAAIASGDTRLTRSFGAEAIGGALQNAEEQKALGATNIYGKDINKFIQAGTEQGLSLRGADPELAAAYTGQSPELLQQKRKLSEVGNTSNSLANNLDSLANSKFSESTNLFAETVRVFRETLAGNNANVPVGGPGQIAAAAQAANVKPQGQIAANINNGAGPQVAGGPAMSEKDLSNLATFSSSVKELSAAVEKLSQSKIQLSLAPTQHTVNITGADVLAAIGPKVEELVYTKIAERFKTFKEELNRGRV